MTRPYRKDLFSATLVGAALAISGAFATPAQAEDTLVVRDFVLTNSVLDREPTNSSTTYNVEDQKVFAFARINNAGGPQTVNFVWHYGAEEHGTVPMNIGTSSGWRTWSSANLKPGNWRVQLVDSNGTVLSEKSFTVGMKAGMAQGSMDQEISTAVSDAPDETGLGDMQTDSDAMSSSSDTGIEDRSGL